MAAGQGAHDEPDLVPLLDLVLQLVMFFMMCANFVMEQVDQTIKLPVARAAKPMTDAKNRDAVFLNVNRDGELLVVGRSKPLATDEEITAYLQSVYDDGKRAAEERAGRAGVDPAQAPVETLVIVRAHEEADYAAIYRVLRKSSDVGLRKVQLRANLDRKG